MHILGGSVVGIFSPLGLFLFFQLAGIYHPWSLKKVAGFPLIHVPHAANMETVKMRFGGSVDEFFPLGFFLSSWKESVTPAC